MKYDIFLSISQTEVDGYIPSEKVMFENFFDQVQWADKLNFGTAWVAETHLSTQIQKQSSTPVVPHFKGEIGLNTDILQLAHLIFERTQNINVGSAIKNILCNGGPLAHAESIKTFLTLHAFRENERLRTLKPLQSHKNRIINIGFASGRFEFSNTPYGIVPRNQTEKKAWKVLKGKILHEATEIFLKALRGDYFSSEEISPQFLRAKDFRSSTEWEAVVEAYAQEFSLTTSEKQNLEKIEIPPYFRFDKVGVIPFEAPLEFLKLTIGTHDPELQELANQYFPIDVFNLSITPAKVIEETHQRMSRVYNAQGGSWQRENMPRTAMIFLDDTPGLSEEEKTQRAEAMAKKAWENYWKAMDGTIDDEKVKAAVDNTLAGSPNVLAQKINEKYHPQDRLMLWFDFNNHDNEFIKHSMKTFMEKVAPQCKN